MNILIVHAHHEPESFSSSLAKQAAATLQSAGHEVEFSDLYQMGFDPVSDRRNFTTTKDAEYLKQQAEESYATENDGFAADVEAEIRKLEAADALIFSFPLWWFGMPAILKGWVDRILVAGRIYGGPKLYENGVGGGTKRAMVVMTTGGGPVAYDGWGLNPSLDTILTPIHHGVFWFNGFQPLSPFVAWSPVRISEEERKGYLDALATRMKGIFTETPFTLPPKSDFPDWGHDQKKRYVVVAERSSEPDEQYRALLSEERRTLDSWKRSGKLLDFQAAPLDTSNWRAFLTIRETDEAAVHDLLATLPLAKYLQFSVTQIAEPKSS